MLGAIIGDIVGSRFEFNNIKTKEFELFKKGKSEVTDDTIMTLAVADILLNHDVNEPVEVIKTFKKWGKWYPDAGYGARFYHWVLGDSTKPYNSCGNGAAMRISAVGYLANSIKEVKDYATKVTEVTHNHPEGIKGAIVTATCIFMAKNGSSMAEIKRYALKEYPVIANYNYRYLQKTIKMGDELCQVSVPEALYCFIISNSFEDCLRNNIVLGGDCDTRAAISCAIAEAYFGIPNELINEALSYLDARQLNIVKQLYGSGIDEFCGGIKPIEINFEENRD